MSTTDYLKKVSGINIGIKLKVAEMNWTQRMLEQLISIWGPYFTRHSSETPALQRSIVKLSLREQEISEQIDELTSQKESAERLFDKLEHPMHRAVMLNRYIEARSFQDIARELNCGLRWVQRVHDRAVAEFEVLYAEEQKQVS
ncbi:MAG: hypothetical protein J6F30_04615 [Cellulosilyticum sp.]|nr:hypothetical protein [Cellulosilyticum sp.]